jgi:hypothetical protein
MLDASALRHAGCIRRLKLHIIDGYRKKTMPNDMEFGTAFHKFRAIFREKGMNGLHEGLHEAQRYYRETPMWIKPQKRYMTEEYLAKCCVDYATQYMNDTILPCVGPDGTKLLEMKFAIPVHTDDVCEIILCGTIDEIGSNRQGYPFIIDAKTTSMSDEKEYLDGYLLSHQFMFYRFVVGLYAQAHPNSVYAEILKYDIANLVDGIFLRGKDKVEFHRSRAWLFKRETLEEFEGLLNATISKVIALVHTSDMPPREGIVTQACETRFSRCEFYYACASPDIESAKAIIDNNFVRIPYNPLTFQT